ncbi:MAG: hypothetical protein GY712_02665, partial [Oceanicoccus sp.]|uniref:hypothetical protein n=1 Tax=Oceanicoccus sp. TaxID=2691044 RepID=UPI0026151DC8
MGILSDIFRVDKVKDVLAAISSDDDYTGYNVLISSALFSSFRNVETISATKELTDGDYQIQLITPSGADRTVELPPEAVTNHPHLIACAAGASYDVVIKDDAGATTYATLVAGEFALCLSSGAAWAVQKFGASGSPLTTKGDLWGYSTADVRIPIGTDTHVLTADSAEALGVKWAAASGGGAVPVSIYGAKLSWVSVSSHKVSESDQFQAENGDTLEITSAITTSGLTSLSNDTIYHIYAYLSGSTVVETVTTAPVLWKGTAYSKTGDTSRRYLGSVLTNGSGDIHFFTMVHDTIFYGDYFTVLSNGQATTDTDVSCSA